jgi:hypothetical protein
MRRIFRPRNLLIAGLLAGAGVAVIAMRRRRDEEKAWSELEGAEADNLATISHLDATTEQGVDAADADSAGDDDTEADSSSAPATASNIADLRVAPVVDDDDDDGDRESRSMSAE